MLSCCKSMAMGRSASRKRGAHSSPSAFGVRLAKLRDERAMTRGELALAAGVTESLLCRLETYARGSTEAETVFRLASALSVRPEWLWRGVEPKELAPAEKRLAELRKRLENVDDKELEEAVAKARRRHHPAIIGVANTFASNGERHTVDGWIARLDEIAEKLGPLLPG